MAQSNKCCLQLEFTVELHRKWFLGIWFCHVRRQAGGFKINQAIWSMKTHKCACG
jgi:hypothetical protein